MSLYCVYVYHAGKFVAAEQVRAKDYFHACRLAEYVAKTVVRLSGIEVTGAVNFDVF